MVNILELKTTQTGPIRILIDTLNSLLTDVNITFLPFYINTLLVIQLLKRYEF